MELIFLIIVLAFISYVLWQLLKNRELFIMQFKLNSNSYVLYLFSLLVPLVGIIVGSIKLSKDDGFNRNIGINCIVCGIISMVVGALIFLK